MGSLTRAGIRQVHGFKESLRVTLWYIRYHKVLLEFLHLYFNESLGTSLELMRSMGIISAQRTYNTS
jgi:hypothetical protein